MRKSAPRRFILHVLVAVTFVTQVFLAAGSRQARGDNNPGVEFTGEAAPPEEPLSLWYRRPAKEWVEAAHMMRMGRVKRLGGRDSAGQAKFVESLFGVAAWREPPPSLFPP